MKRISISLTLIFFTLISVNAQLAGVPKQYKAIQEVLGDLDKDGIAEKAIVYNMTDSEDVAEGINREIIIFKKTKGVWAIWQRSTEAIGNSKDGGMMGDPFEDLQIKNGLLIISESGGSSWKWGHTDKYRFQNGQFELIGYSSDFGKLCEYWANIDYNISTGKLAYKKEYERCDDDDGDQKVYKTEKENFVHKPSIKLTLQNRKSEDIKIVTPKYKVELYL